MSFRHNICVDLDGVLAKYDKYRGEAHFGDPIPGAVEFTKRLSLAGRVIIFTARCREAKNYDLVKNYLDQHGFRYDEIYVGIGKPIASVYIDDRAISCRPQETANPYSLYEAVVERSMELMKKKDVEPTHANTATSTTQ